MSRQAKKTQPVMMYGMSFPSEKAAIVTMLAGLALEEAAAGVAIRRWIDICRNPELRGGLRIIAEREAYHGRLFKQRLGELGGAPAKPTREPRIKAINDSLGDPTLSDRKKLARLHDYSPGTAALLAPLKQFALSIQDDVETRQALLLYIEDEISSGNFLCGLHHALADRAAARKPQKQPRMAAE